MIAVKNIEIKGLFDQFNVDVPLGLQANIFVGENGMGKTTILNCLYAVLSGKIEKLSNINFDSIAVYFKDGTNAGITSQDAIAYNEHLFKGGAVRRRINFETIFTSREIEIMQNYNEINDVDLAKFIYRISDTYMMPTNYAERELRRYMIGLKKEKKKGNYKNVIKFKEVIESKVKEEVIYFPTYRRIEEDLNKLGIHVDRERNSFNDKLIQFGMNDVDKVIEKLLDEIKLKAINGFNKMTGILLNQYLHAQLELNKVEEIDRDSLVIALDRLGDEINKSDKMKIIELVENNKMMEAENEYLLNLIMNLISSYKEQSSIDEKIKSFSNTCNKYLNDKKYIYDESNVDLKIFRNNYKWPIEIQNLSSGEKQVISIFAKLYFEIDDKCILLFDEPELSLSIKWQSMFLPDVIDTKKCSMLVAVTHSPFIFDNDFDEIALDMSDCIRDKNVQVN
ncbi:MAG: AAA family ATPase [Firmicutes bacterium]|nr:AAA family ATPase [Bacillota bacterium]